MGLLGIFSFGFIFAVLTRQVVIAKFGPDGGAAITNRFANHGNAICPHISNETRRFPANINAFIKHLRGAHGLGRREA